jgi:hypothetical protein
MFSLLLAASISPLCRGSHWHARAQAVRALASVSACTTRVLTITSATRQRVACSHATSTEATSSAHRSSSSRSGATPCAS